MNGILIKNGLVVDGSGAPGRVADILIEEDRIKEIARGIVPPEKEDESGLSIIDAAGKVVCPGFVDMHGHSDFSILIDGSMQEKTRQGITTTVIGSCGFSAAPATPRYEGYLKRFTGGMFGENLHLENKSMGEYLAQVQSSGLGGNIVAQVGFANLRTAVKGIRPGGLNSEELKKTTDMLRQALDEGARGFSTGLFYPPQNMSKAAEIKELCRVLKGRDVIYSTHLRNEMDNLQEAAAEAIETARDTGVSLQISHLKAIMERNYGKVEKVIEMIDGARAQGVDVSTDVYPYNAFANIVLPFILKYEKGVEDKIIFLYMKHHKEYEGKTLAEAMKMNNAGARATVLKLAVREGFAGMPVAGFLMDEKDVRFLVAHPEVCIGSDGVESFGKKTHPRLWGSFPRVLEKYCRDEKIITLEAAIRKMTSTPAEKLRIKQRGLLKENYFADIVIFDPDNIRENTTFEDPVKFPTGFEAVIVNGKTAVYKDIQSGTRPGRVL